MSAQVIAATDPGAIDRAEKILRQGGLVVIPTETVYGLAALATSDQAIERIYSIKGRAHTKALIAHVDGPDMASQVGELDELAKKLIKAFWPGPLTLIVPRRTGAKLSAHASGGLSSEAIRCPDHDFTRQLIHDLAQPLVAPSANLAGAKEPVSVEEISPLISSSVDLIVDGGPCAKGRPSTLLDLCTRPPMILRQGALSKETLEQVCGNIG
jgi:L-threonylcarbamoyladenylate synthase